MKITVTQKHIDQGRKNYANPYQWKAQSCPIAVAIQEKVNSNHVYVSQLATKVDGDSYRLPKEAKHFMQDFDNAIPVQPFEFEMELA